MDSLTALEEKASIGTHSSFCKLVYLIIAICFSGGKTESVS